MIADAIHRICADCGKMLGPSQYDGDSASCWACVIKNAPQHICVCGKAFKPKQANSRACSVQCHQKLHRQEVATKKRIGRRCLQCNKSIALLAQTHKRYCSDSCRWKAERVRKMQGKPKRRVTCALPGCDVSFETYHPNKQYCCEAHRVKGKSINRYRRDFATTAAPEPKPVKVVEPDPVDDKFTDNGHGHIKTGQLTGKGYSFSGFSENRPRELTAPAPMGCPSCRASGKDYQGRIVHSSWCSEVSAS